VHVPEEANLIRSESEGAKNEIHVAGTRIFHYVISVEWKTIVHTSRGSRYGTVYVGPKTTPGEVFMWALDEATRVMQAKHQEHWGLSEGVVEELRKEGFFGDPFVVAWDLRPNESLA
jgi:hypothetical protein